MEVLLAVGTSAASSSDVTVADGAVVTLLARGAGSVMVQLKNSDDAYQNIGTLDALSDADNSKQIGGPVTFRVTRSAGQSAGCDIEAAA